MTMQEQPPPEPDHVVEVPPAEGDQVTPRKPMTLGMVITVFIVLVMLVMIFPLVFFRQSKPATRTEAISNAKQIGLALLEFEQEYGKFPDETTVEALLDSTGGTDVEFKGSSSNAMFRQLVEYGIQTEDIFYCLHPEFSKVRPDNRIKGSQALEPGEVRFSYVAGLDTSMPPGIPVLAAPMKLHTDKFHDKVFGDKCVILRLDNSAKVLQIRSHDQRALIGGGKTLFDPANGIWPVGHVIDLRHPEK